MRIGLKHDSGSAKGWGGIVDRDPGEKRSKNTDASTGEVIGRGKDTEDAVVAHEEGKEEQEPWNAICVVGLKVFTYKTIASTKSIVASSTKAISNNASPVSASTSTSTKQKSRIRLDLDDPEKDVIGGGAGQGKLPSSSYASSLSSFFRNSRTMSKHLRNLKIRNKSSEEGSLR